MPKKTDISIVMPLYNKEAEVLRAIRSVLLQSMEDFELIIVDDGSTDSGLSMVKTLRDPRVRILSQKNAGVSAARNRGIQEARSEVIAFLDADDEWERGFLETIMRLRRIYTSARVYATRYSFRKTKIPPREAVIRDVHSGFVEGILPNYFRIAARSDPPIWSSAVAVDASAIRDVGGFPIGVTVGEDLLTWARLAAKYQVAYCMKPLSNFWASDRQESRPSRRPQEPDAVSDALRKLKIQCGSSTKEDVNEYLGLWFRMRGSIYLQLDETEKARIELRKARALSRASLSLGVLFLISLMPTRIGRIFYRTLSQLRPN